MLDPVRRERRIAAVAQTAVNVLGSRAARVCRRLQLLHRTTNNRHTIKAE